MFGARHWQEGSCQKGSILPKAKFSENLKVVEDDKDK